MHCAGEPVLGLLAASKFDLINEGYRVDNFQPVVRYVSGVNQDIQKLCTGQIGTDLPPSANTPDR